VAQNHERLGTRKIVFDALSCTKASANVGAGTRRLRDLGSALGDLSPQRAERGIHDTSRSVPADTPSQAKNNEKVVFT